MENQMEQLENEFFDGRWYKGEDRPFYFHYEGMLCYKESVFRFNDNYLKKYCPEAKHNIARFEKRDVKTGDCTFRVLEKDESSLYDYRGKVKYNENNLFSTEFIVPGHELSYGAIEEILCRMKPTAMRITREKTMWDMPGIGWVLLTYAATMVFCCLFKNFFLGWIGCTILLIRLINKFIWSEF